mgnify:CR=1 FL=1
MSDPPRRLKASDVADRLASHEKECAERYGTILTEIRTFRQDVDPLIKVWQAGGVAIRLIKLIALVATTIAAVWAVIRLRGPA